MQILMTVSVGFMLVLGQSLWKFATNTATAALIKNPTPTSFFNSALAVALQPAFIVGCFIYAAATILYIYVISKYNYGVTYAMIVGCSTIFATTISAVIFKEKIYPLNLLGILIIIIGISLVVKK